METNEIDHTDVQRTIGEASGWITTDQLENAREKPRQETQVSDAYGRRGESEVGVGLEGGSRGRGGDLLIRWRRIILLRGWKWADGLADGREQYIYSVGQSDVLRRWGQSEPRKGWSG